METSVEEKTISAYDMMMKPILGRGFYDDEGNSYIPTGEVPVKGKFPCLKMTFKADSRRPRGGTDLVYLTVEELMTIERHIE